MKRNFFKYQEIAVSLEGRIASGEFKGAAAMPPEGVLSREYGVNHLTFRRAMDILVRNGRVTRFPGRGTFIVENGAAAAGRDASSKTILYAGDMESHFFRELYLSVLRIAQSSGHRLTTFDSNALKGGKVLARNLKSRMDESGSVICNKCCLEAALSLCRRSQKTIVLVDIYGGGAETAACYSLSSNVFLAARMATEHLISLGHRKIAFVGSPDRACGHSAFRVPSRSRLTYQGYAISFFMHGIPMPENLAGGPLGESNDDCERSISAWLKTFGDWPTAFVCEGDFRAAALIRAAARLKRFAPADFSVVGTGNTPWAEMMNPSLTSVYMGEKEMARTAVLLATQPAPDESHIMHILPKLIIRNSSAVLK